MSTVVKAYTFLPRITVDFCEVNRNFDDLYTTINNLNSENMAASYDQAACQVSIVDTASNYTSTELESTLGEINTLISSVVPALYEGYNSIHVITQRSKGILVPIGKVEVNGNLHELTEELSITAVTLLSGAYSGNGLYALAVTPSEAGAAISASSFRLIALADTSATNGMDVAKNGYYFSSNYRILHVLANIHSEAATQCLYYYEALGSLNRSFKRILTGSEAGHHGFHSEGTTITLDDEKYKMSFNHETNRFNYEITDTISATTVTYSFALPLTYGFSANGQGAMGYVIKGYQWYETDGNYRTNEHGTSISSTGAYRFNIYLGGASAVYENMQLKVVNAYSNGTGTWIASLEPNGFLGAKDF